MSSPFASSTVDRSPSEDEANQTIVDQQTARERQAMGAQQQLVNAYQTDTSSLNSSPRPSTSSQVEQPPRVELPTVQLLDRDQEISSGQPHLTTTQPLLPLFGEDEAGRLYTPTDPQEQRSSQSSIASERRSSVGALPPSDQQPSPTHSTRDDRPTTVQWSSEEAAPDGTGTATVNRPRLSTVTGQLAGIRELQRRIQALQREAEHFREVNSVLQLNNDLYERERLLFQRELERDPAESRHSSDFRGFEPTSRLPERVTAPTDPVPPTAQSHPLHGSGPESSVEALQRRQPTPASGCGPLPAQTDRALQHTQPGLQPLSYRGGQMSHYVSQPTHTRDANAPAVNYEPYARSTTPHLAREVQPVASRPHQQPIDSYYVDTYATSAGYRGPAHTHAATPPSNGTRIWRPFMTTSPEPREREVEYPMAPAPYAEPGRSDEQARNADQSRYADQGQHVNQDRGAEYPMAPALYAEPNRYDVQGRYADHGRYADQVRPADQNRYVEQNRNADQAQYAVQGRYAHQCRYADQGRDAGQSWQVGPSRYGDPDRFANPDQYVDTYRYVDPNRYADRDRYVDQNRYADANRNTYRNRYADPYADPTRYADPVRCAPPNWPTPYRRLLDLPPFSGHPEEWPFFICSFEETTRQYGYTDLENMGRLQKALAGEAKARVRGILIRPEHVGRTVETLAKAFGRPDMLAESQLNLIRKLPKINDDRQLISFSITVDGMVSLLDGPATDHLLRNSLLLKDLTSKLPPYDQRIWASISRHIGPNPSIREFARWLADVAEDVANVGSTWLPDVTQSRNRDQRQSAARSSHVLLNVTSRESDTTGNGCAFCGEGHPIYQCDAFGSLTPPNRLTEVRKRPLCYWCLGTGHLVPSCERTQLCGVDGCERRHHQLLHRAFESNQRQAPRSNAPNPSLSTNDSAPGPRSRRHQTDGPSNSQNTALLVSQPDRVNASDGSQPLPTDNRPVLNCQRAMPLQTLYYRIVPVVLYGPRRRQKTYALLDEGSSVSLIDAELAEELELGGESQTLNLQFVGGASSSQLSRKVGVGISGVDPDAIRFDIDTLQTAKDLSLPMQSVDGEDVLMDNPHLADIPFATFDCIRPKVLLGLEHHFLGVPHETRVGPRLRSVAAARTNLGWVLYGSNGRSTLPGAVVLHTRAPDGDTDEEVQRLDQLHELVRHHFTTESFGVKVPKGPIQSDTDRRALAILEATTKRIGYHFETGLLWSKDNVKLPNNRGMALRRLVSVESKMRRDPAYADRYKSEIQAYLEKGYARRMSDEEASTVTPRTWYLPHFAIQNANKPGKFRLVFDAAASVYDVSLNSMLLAGPDLNVPLTRLLFRFRIGSIGVCADVKEMFHQVAIRKEDQDAQRFLWRDGDALKEPDVYVMNVMTFGSACSPTAAQYVKNTNAKEFAGRFPEAADAIQRNHYVDDFVASFRTTHDAQRITAQVIELQKRGGFDLRGVVSNCPAVRQRFGAHEDGRSVRLEPEDASQKILGMMWETTDDIFTFQTRFIRVDPAVISGSRRPTKREVLSVAMSIFDPFGLLADFLLPTKTILQELWRRGVQWDEPIPEDVNARWQEWRAQVEQTRRVQIPRCYSPSILDAPGLQLHVFADASEEAFAAVAYWRVSGPDGVELSFVAGKVRCAPLKILSVPRLELQAAVLATRLMIEIRQSHDGLQIDKIVFWSDSETVLKWLRCGRRRYVQFVAFRVAEVVESAPADWWRWVPTGLNVADDATRVKSPIVFDPKSRWLLGPTWLKGDETSWPEQQFRSDSDEADGEELRPRFVGAVSTRGAVEFERFSDFTRLTRCVARVRRFIFNVRATSEARQRGQVGADELERATHEICRQVQQTTYAEEIDALSSGHDIRTGSKIFPLKPYLDDEGLLRVHGRTDAASEEYLCSGSKRPIIMPPNHHVTTLIVHHHHELCAHQLTDATIASVRSKFWVPNLRSLVKRVRRSCQTCRVRDAAPRPVFQGQLPADRLHAYARPFTNTGLDFFGPFQVTIGRRREKRWVALFTCLVTRAVHLEVAADLSTDACLICLRNLCHLRGIPSIIRCDNGTNFVGARNELDREAGFFDPDVVQRELAAKGVQWKFNCPLNPEAGGAWERLVQSIKRVLRVTLHEEAPRVETFRALLLEAANVVNSRPLTHLAVEPDDPDPITPNHFLMGGPNVATAPNPADVEPRATRRQWQICRGLSRQFWRQFVRDYMPELTRRSKHYTDVPPLRIGDMVILCDEQQPKGRWTRGMITDVATAEDGAVRTATVQTAYGTFRRPASRLAKIDVSPSGGVDERGAVSTTGTPRT